MGLDRTELARQRQWKPRGVAAEYSMPELHELDAINDAAELLMEMQRVEAEAVQQDWRSAAE